MPRRGAVLAPVRAVGGDGGMKPIHPDAQILPAMTDVEYDRLAGSIEQDGLLEPITLYEGKILVKVQQGTSWQGKAVRT